MKSFARPALLALVATVVTASAAAGERWVHIHVDESGADGTRVRIQLPLSVVRAALPHVKADGLESGRLRLAEGAIDPADVAAARDALESALGGETVEIGDPGHPLRMERSGNWLVLTGSADGEGRIRVQVPTALARDVLRDLPGEIDLLAILDGIEEAGDVEIATIDGDDASVRIWIDASVASE